MVVINKLRDLLQRAESWPEETQEELLQIGLEIEAGRGVDAPLSTDDVEALKQSAEDVRLGRYASEGEVREVFDRYRGR